MEAKKRISQPMMGALAGAGLVVGIGLALHIFRVGLGLIHWSYDLPFAVRANIGTDEAVLIYMDDASHAALQQPFNTAWSRALHEQLVRRLTKAGARAIVFDVVFADASPNPEVDRAFAAAMTNHGRVVLAADTVQAIFDPSMVSNMRNVTPPTDVLRDAAADIGSAEMKPAQDFAVRRHFHGSSDDVLTSVSWATARLLGAAATTNDATRQDERWLNYYGPPGTLPSLSYHRALDTNAPLNHLFRGKVVFIGANLLTVFAGERKDQFRSPYSYWNPKNQFMSGVEVQATVFLNLLRGDWLRRGSPGVERAVLVLLGLVFGLGLVRFRPSMATLVAGLSVLLVIAGAYSLAALQSVWFPWLLVVAEIAVALFWSILFNSIQLYVQKKLYEHTLGLYLSPKLVRKFSSDAKLLKPGAEKQTLTILFSDIANFTSISEGMDSDELARSMNGYFQNAVSLCIHPTDGTVVKYIGDAIFAFWNAPEPQDDHALRACLAALNFHRQEAQAMNGQPLITRIGLHTGVANVGNFGSTERVDYTALGENINLASRMEGLNKYLGTTLLATGETFAAVTGKVISRFAGRFRLKGFERAVDVHELIGTPEEAEATRPWRDTFGEALRHFQERNFAAAEAGFRRTLELHPGDGPAEFYLTRLAELPPGLLPDEWTGEVELKDK